MIDENEHVKLFRLHSAGQADGTCDAEAGRESDDLEGNWGKDPTKVNVYCLAYRKAFGETARKERPLRELFGDLWMGEDDWE